MNKRKFFLKVANKDLVILRMMILESVTTSEKLFKKKIWLIILKGTHLLLELFTPIRSELDSNKT